MCSSDLLGAHTGRQTYAFTNAKTYSVDSTNELLPNDIQFIGSQPSTPLELRYRGNQTTVEFSGNFPRDLDLRSDLLLISFVHSVDELVDHSANRIINRLSLNGIQFDSSC